MKKKSKRKNIVCDRMFDPQSLKCLYCENFLYCHKLYVKAVKLARKMNKR